MPYKLHRDDYEAELELPVLADWDALPDEEELLKESVELPDCGEAGVEELELERESVR